MTQDMEGDMAKEDGFSVEHKTLFHEALNDRALLPDVVASITGIGMQGVTPGQIIAILQFACKVGQPFIDWACPLIENLPADAK